MSYNRKCSFIVLALAVLMIAAFSTLWWGKYVVKHTNHYRDTLVTVIGDDTIKYLEGGDLEKANIGHDTVVTDSSILRYNIPFKDTAHSSTSYERFFPIITTDESQHTSKDAQGTVLPDGSFDGPDWMRTQLFEIELKNRINKYDIIGSGLYSYMSYDTFPISAHHTLDLRLLSLERDTVIWREFHVDSIFNVEWFMVAKWEGKEYKPAYIQPCDKPCTLIHTYEPIKNSLHYKHIVGSNWYVALNGEQFYVNLVFFKQYGSDAIRTTDYTIK